MPPPAALGLIALPMGQGAGRQADRHGLQPEKAELARAHGAWATIDYSRENVVERLLD